MDFETERSPHDLTHLSFVCGEIGRLIGLSMIPALPGDGCELDIVGAVRLSPLRRGLVMDSVCDVCTFYIPYRHIYGQDWITFIEQGWDETVTFTGETMIDEDYGFAPIGSAQDGTLPLWIPEGYRQIWNRWYRPPTTVAERTDALSSWANSERRFGFECGWLKRIWNTGVDDALTAADYQVSTAGDVLSLLDLDAQVGRLRTEQEREFFNVRYDDIVRNAGGYTTFDADERPVLLKRSTFWASGYDVDGTSETSLGQHSGRVVQQFRHRVPRWHVPEHGTVWTVALVRFPPTSEEECHYLVTKSNPTYQEIGGDPDIVRSQPPYDLNRNEVFFNASSESLGLVPYANWYRSHPDNVHPIFDNVNGFPFVENVPDNEHRYLVRSPAYDQCFQTTQLGHYNVAARINAVWPRRLPSARDSLMYGG